MWYGRPTWAEIDLDVIEHNVKEIRKHVGEKTEILAVVKANAYGLGAVPVSRAALSAGASRLGVACVDEGIELRQAGIDVPILVLGYVPCWETEDVVKHNLTPTVVSREQALAFSDLATQYDTELPVHVKVDTGLSRFGLKPDEAIDVISFLHTLPSLQVEGLWTHFASADETDKSFTHQQFKAFTAVASQFPDIPCHHVGASSVAIDLPHMGLNLVRVGIAIYGLYPSDEVMRSVSLRPALGLKSRVARVYDLSVGDTVSYGRTWSATRPTRAALVPCGYADGLRRALSNKGAMLINGKRAPILGRVCMDQTVVDVTDIPGVEVDDEVVLIGRQGNEEITAEDHARWAATINYEIICGITSRVPRVYLRDGEAVEVITPITARISNPVESA